MNMGQFIVGNWETLKFKRINLSKKKNEWNFGRVVATGDSQRIIIIIIIIIKDLLVMSCVVGMREWENNILLIKK